MQTAKVLGVRFHLAAPGEALDEARRFLDADGGMRAVYTPNPEIVMRARKDAAFMDVLNRGDLVIPDGIGVVYAMRMNGVKIKERVTGYDLVQGLLAGMAEHGRTVYFLGGKEESVSLAKANMETKYPGLQIVGYHNGFFDAEKEILIIEEIQRLKPDLLLVFLGAPKQEKWIDAHRELPVRLAIGVGGSVDVMSGMVPRAPAFYQKHGLEWLYRLAKQPSRWKRQLILPKFMLVVLWNRLFGNKTKER